MRALGVPSVHLRRARRTLNADRFQRQRAVDIDEQCFPSHTSSTFGRVIVLASRLSPGGRGRVVVFYVGFRCQGGQPTAGSLRPPAPKLRHCWRDHVVTCGNKKLSETPTYCLALNLPAAMVMARPRTPLSTLAIHMHPSVFADVLCVFLMYFRVWQAGSDDPARVTLETFARVCDGPEFGL